MKTEEARAIVERHLVPFMAALGVPHWKVTVDYGRCERETWIVQCSRNGDYWKAYITIDPAKHEDEEELLDSLRHELLHVLIAPFDLFVDAALQHVPDGDASRAMDRIREHAVEATVRNLERMLGGWTYSRDGYRFPLPAASAQ